MFSLVKQHFLPFRASAGELKIDLENDPQKDLKMRLENDLKKNPKNNLRINDFLASPNVGAHRLLSLVHKRVYAVW